MALKAGGAAELDDVHACQPLPGSEYTHVVPFGILHGIWWFISAVHAGGHSVGPVTTGSTQPVSPAPVEVVAPVAPVPPCPAPPCPPMALLVGSPPSPPPETLIPQLETNATQIKPKNDA
jgi:hypothetical protein